jgi:hypothetical protein
LPSSLLRIGQDIGSLVLDHHRFLQHSSGILGHWFWIIIAFYSIVPGYWLLVLHVMIAFWGNDKDIDLKFGSLSLFTA